MFIMSKPCSDITHCGEIFYTVLNMCFKTSRYLELYYRYDDILAVNNDLTVSYYVPTIFGWIDKLSNELKRDLKEKILL